MSRSKRRFNVKNCFIYMLLPFFMLTLSACSDQAEDPAILVLTVSTDELPADGKSATQIQAEISDSAGFPVERATNVTFRTNLGTFRNGKQEYRVETIDDSGELSVQLHAGTETGTAEVVAKSKGVSQKISVRFVDPSKVFSTDLRTGSDSIVADGNSYVSVTLRAMGPSEGELEGDPVEGLSVNFATTLGGIRTDNPAELGNYGNSLYSISKNKQATAVTDVDGEATVWLVSGKNSGIATITAEVAGQILTAEVIFKAGKPVSMELRATPGTIRPGDTTGIIARIADINDNPVEGEVVAFDVVQNDSGGVLESLSAATNINGEAIVSYTAGSGDGKDRINARSVSDSSIYDLTDITIDASAFPDSAIIGTLEVTASNIEIVADGNSSTGIRARVLDIDGNPVSGRRVEFTTSYGELSSAMATTDENGTAEVILTSDTRTGVATVQASIPAEGFSENVEVRFVSGPPVNAYSSITVQPSTIPADGVSTAEVTVTLADAQGNPVSNGTEVELYASRGTIITGNPAVTASGRVTFTVQSSASTGTAELSLWDYPDIGSAILRFGTITSGAPSSILIESVSNEEIAVTGVGKNDNSAISVRIVDETGTTVVRSGMDLRATLLARPDGGEFISGEGSSGNVVRSVDEEPFEEVEIGASSGEATLNLRSGILPGVVEVKLEVLQSGESLEPQVVTVSRQLSIASGPPHTIVLSAPTQDAVVNLNEEGESGIPQTPGFYSRRAGLIVTDRYGNAVPDGTTLNLGVIDSVISEGTGSISSGENILEDGFANFSADSILRDGLVRVIQPNDRVILFGVAAADKSRFVRTPIGTDTLPVSKEYTTSENNIEYAVGASLLGATIYGTDGTDATKGTVRTENGLAQLRLVYPASSNRILSGCYGNPATDTRHEPTGSARVISVFTGSDDSASLVDEGTLCFSAIAPATLTAAPDEISLGTYNINLTLEDGGDQVRLPFVPVTASVRWSEGSDVHDVIFSTGNTNEAGEFVSVVNVERQSQNSGWFTIDYFALGAKAEVSGFVPSDFDWEE